MPSNITLPPSGLSTPVHVLTKVDFPAPLGPINIVIEFLFTFKETLFTATSPPNLLVKFSVTSM